MPNFGPPKNDRFERLRIRYEPKREKLEIGVEDSTLVLSVGEADIIERFTGKRCVFQNKEDGHHRMVVR